MCLGYPACEAELGINNQQQPVHVSWVPCVYMSHEAAWLELMSLPLSHVSKQWCLTPLTRTFHASQHHAHAHAHANFISTTTKPLPDSATNTDYDTLTLTAFTTTPICNLLQPGTDVGLQCPLSVSLGTRARMARINESFLTSMKATSRLLLKVTWPAMSKLVTWQLPWTLINMDESYCKTAAESTLHDWKLLQNCCWKYSTWLKATAKLLLRVVLWLALAKHLNTMKVPSRLKYYQ
jgi:hypothetical protein